MTSALTSPTLKPSRYAWTLVALLAFVALLNYMDRLLITTMRDPILADIPMTDAHFGLLTSVFLWVYAAVSPLGGFLADRVGRRKIIVASLVFWSIATFATGLAHSFPALLSARALMGFSEACYIPAALALIADYHPGPTRSLATGLHMVGLYTGAALGGIGGYLSQWFGWSVSFKILGAVGVAYGLILLTTLRDAPIQDNQHNPRDIPRLKLSSTLTSLLSRPAFLILLLLNILVGIVNWAIYGWMPTYLKEHFKLGLGAAGLSGTAYIQIASFAGVLIAGALADRWSRKRLGARALVPALAYLLAGPCLMLTGTTELFPLAIAGLLIFGLARGAFDANQMPLLRELVDQRYSATGYGLLNFVSTSAGGIMIYIGGAMKDAHVDLGQIFLLCGIGLLGAGLLLWIISMMTTPSSRDISMDQPGDPSC